MVEDPIELAVQLANHHGIAPAPGEDGQVVHQPTAERAGVLTLDCVLAQLEREDRQASFWSLLAVLSPEGLGAAP